MLAVVILSNLYNTNLKYYIGNESNPPSLATFLYKNSNCFNSRAVRITQVVEKMWFNSIDHLVPINSSKSPRGIFVLCNLFTNRIEEHNYRIGNRTL